MTDHRIKIGVLGDVLVIEIENGRFDSGERLVARFRRGTRLHLQRHLNEVTGNLRKQDDPN